MTKIVWHGDITPEKELSETDTPLAHIAAVHVWAEYEHEEDGRACIYAPLGWYTPESMIALSGGTVAHFYARWLGDDESSPTHIGYASERRLWLKGQPEVKEISEYELRSFALTKLHQKDLGETALQFMTSDKALQQMLHEMCREVCGEPYAGNIATSVANLRKLNSVSADSADGKIAFSNLINLHGGISPKLAAFVEATDLDIHVREK
jgi:hypothetical protein